MPQRPRPLTLDEAIESAVSHRDVVLAVDFDGTLAPLAPRPDLATPDPQAIVTLQHLADRPGIHVAVVSGRSRHDLEDRLGPMTGVTLIGEHGNDLEIGADPEPRAESVSEMAAVVAGLAERFPGAVIEVKRRSVTFHYRNVADHEAALALQEIEAWASARPQVKLLEGKKVVELTTATRNKGDAVMELAGTAPVIYLGDDATDETVFTVMRPGDVGIKVGAGETAAGYRVEDVAGVVTILEKIALASE